MSERSNTNFSQDGRPVSWQPTNPRSAVAAPDLGFHYVNPIIIVPDKDDKTDELASLDRKIETSNEHPTAVPKSMTQFQISEHNVLFRNAGFPTSANQRNVFQGTSGNSISSPDANCFSPKMNQFPQYPPVTAPQSSTNVPVQGHSGKVYLQSSDRSIKLSEAGTFSTCSNTTAAVNQIYNSAPNVQLLTSRDVPQMMGAPPRYSECAQPPQHNRTIRNIMQHRPFAPSASTIQAAPPLHAPPSSKAAQNETPASIVIILRQSPVDEFGRQQTQYAEQTQNAGVSNKVEYQTFPSSVPQHTSTGSERSASSGSFQALRKDLRGPQESVQHVSNYSYHAENQVPLLEVLKREVDVDVPHQNLAGADAKVFGQSMRPPFCNQIQQQQSSEGSQNARQNAASSLDGRNMQPFVLLEGPNSEPQCARERNLQSQCSGMASQSLDSKFGQAPVGSLGVRNFSQQSSAAVTSFQTQSQGRMNFLPQSTPSGQTFQPQGPTFQPQSSVGGQTFQPQGLTFQPQSSLGCQSLHLQNSLSGQNLQIQGSALTDSNLQQQNSFDGSQEQSMLNSQNQQQQQASFFGNSFQSQNMQPHGQYTQQQSSVSVGVAQNADTNTNFNPLLAAQQCLQTQQLPTSTESHFDRLHQNHLSAESRQTPDMVSSGMQHQFGSVLSGQETPNSTARHLEYSSSRPSSNQNSESNRCTPSLNRAALEMLSHLNSPAPTSSLSDGSGGSRSASASLLPQTYGAMAGMQNSDAGGGNVALPSVQDLFQQQTVGQHAELQDLQDQQIQQQNLQQQNLQQQEQQMQQQQLQQQIQQQTMQQGVMQQFQQQLQQQPLQQQQLQQQEQQTLQMQQQQLDLQQLQQQMQQQQLLQQFQSNFGVPWPSVTPVDPNQTLFANNAPQTVPGGDIMSQLLPFMFANLPMLNYLSQSLSTFSNPSLGGFNAFSMPQQQPTPQQQFANMLAASLGQSLAPSPAPCMIPSGIDSNTLTGFLCQMLAPGDLHAQAPTPPPQPADNSTANMMHMMLQSLRGPDISGCAAGQQLLRSLPPLFGSSPESGSRPGSVAGQGLDGSQLSQLSLSIDEASVHSLVEPPPNATTDELNSTAGQPPDAAPQKSDSTKAAPAAKQKRKAKGRSARTKRGRGAAGKKIKGGKDDDQSENESKGKKDSSETDESEDAGEEDVEGDNDDDDGAANPADSDPRVYIDVAWDPSCSPTKRGASKPLSESKCVVQNGRRVASEAEQKKGGLGRKNPDNKTLESSRVGGVKRRGGKTSEMQRSRKKERMDSDEESDDEPLKTDAKTKEKIRNREEEKTTSPLRSAERKGSVALLRLRSQSETTEEEEQEVSEKSRVGASRSKATAGSRKAVENQATRKGPRGQSLRKKADEGTGRDRTLSRKGKARKGARRAESSDMDDSSNGGVSADSPASTSTSDSVEPSTSKASLVKERNKTLLQCTKNLPTVSMPMLNLVSVDSALKQSMKLEKAAELLGVRKCRLKQLTTATKNPDLSDADDRRGSFSDSSSSGDFGSSRDHWKPKSKRRGRGSAGGFRFGKRVAVMAKKPETETVASVERNATVGPNPSNDPAAESGPSQMNPDSAATSTAETSTTQVPFVPTYARRGRGRPSLFQTFQSSLRTNEDATASTSATPAVGVGRISPPMPVLIKETAVRAVARVSPLVPPPGDEVWKERLKSVELLDSLNDHINSPLQTVFVKLDESSDVMNVLISFKTLGDNMVFQCTFCPFTDYSAKVVSDHVRRLHISYMFAATRTPMPTGDVLYLFCRHCSFVTHDRISMWIHFEICHGIADVVYGSDVKEVTPQVSRRLVLNREQQAIVPSVYQCLDCDLLVADNRHIAEHAVKNHCEDGSCYRGCFAKARVINKPKSAPIQVTYAQLLSDEYVDQRKEVFICVRCSYIAYAEFLAISHHIMSHLELKMIFLCHVEGCGNREASSEAAILHIRAAHADVNTRILRGTVTLVSQSAGDEPIVVECEMLERKDSSGKKKANAQKASAAQPVDSEKTTEKSASSKSKEKGSDRGESMSDDSSHERQSSTSGKSIDRKKVKRTISKHGPKYN